MPPVDNGVVSAASTAARSARASRRILELEAATPVWPAPENHEKLVALLTAARERLRRRLLVAEGVDPRTGEPVA